MGMTESYRTPQGTVVIAMLVAGASTTLGDIADGKGPQIRVALGVTVAGTILLVAAEFVPDLATGFAVLVMLTALLVKGGPAWRALGNVSKTTSHPGLVDRIGAANPPKPPGSVGHAISG